MNPPPTQEEIDHMRSIAGQITSAIFAAAGPHIIELIAAAKKGIKYTRVGDQCVIEPVDPLAGLDLTAGTLTAGEEFQPLRDYRKQLWIEIFAAAYSSWPESEAAEEKANIALTRFDAAFPK